MFMYPVCETSQCLDITCPVGMAVVSTRIQEQCCPSQTCGRSTKSITMWLSSICISVFVHVYQCESASVRVLLVCVC